MQTAEWTLPLTRQAEPWFCDVVWGGNELALENFTMPGLDGYLLSVPSADKRTGGDIYHVTVCNHGVFSKFLLIDVAGHDESAARISTRLKQPLAKLMTELGNGAILEELNSNILSTESSGSFATAASATYNHWDRSLTYAYAGHPDMLIRRNGVWQALPECYSGPPIGILGDIRYFENEIQLNGEDWLFLFSDAVFEIKRENGTRLGFDGLIELLNGIEQTAIDSFYQALIDALITMNGKPQFADDLTLFLLKQQPASKKLLARPVDGIRKLLMRWMKRKEPRCSSQLPPCPQTANL
ncbi:MAG: SpoIIE family protein phosphatase [Thermotogales bacterium]|nr:SpoIIE family protein phosphatase [Thermotogales bacterium]